MSCISELALKGDKNFLQKKLDKIKVALDFLSLSLNYNLGQLRNLKLENIKNQNKTIDHTTRHLRTIFFIKFFKSE